MDRKPERVVQTKVRDFKNKNKKNMSAEACREKNTLRQSTNGDFFQTLNRQWVFPPRGISCYLVLGFTPSTTRFVQNSIISKEKFAECLYCDVSQRPILPVVSCLIELTCHVFIHSCTHNRYITTFIHGRNSYPESCLVVSFRFGPQSNTCQVASSNQQTACIYLSFSQGVVPCFFRKWDVTQSLSSQVFHSPVCRITECQVFHSPVYRIKKYQKYHSPIYRITEYQKYHSPVYRITEYQKLYSPLYQITEYQVFHSPHCRMTEYQKLHSPLCRITEYQVIHSPFCRITECQVSFPGLSDYGISKVSFPVLSDYGSQKYHSPVYRITEYQMRLSPFCWITEGQQCHLPVCRMTRRHSISILSNVSFPVLSDNRMSTVSSPGMSDDETSHNFYSIKCIIPHFLSSYNYQYDSRQ